MRGVGLGLKLGQLLRQGPTKKCERCGLSYFTKQFDQCPHCSDLDDSQLKSLLHRIEREARGNSAIGVKFLICAVLLMFLIVFINL